MGFGDGGRDGLGIDAAAQEGEDEGVDQDCGEHADEDPEVVQPETLLLVVVADPALYCVSWLALGG